MSMLAGPRRKQKVINLRAKNSAWSNDANKFGQRMLEKMGWSSGKGLGAKENGIVEHVVAKYKNDEKGLGFEDRNDQWTKHEDDFNALLSNLSNGDGKDDKLHSGISLEVKSKKSKARVHYHKFTRGKDLTRYSEKDLANIFGKKSLRDDEKEDKVEEILGEKETEQKFSEKGSMEDYFKDKLAAFKSRTNWNFSNNEKDADQDYGFQGFSGTQNDVNESSNPGFGFQSFSFNNNSKDSESDKEPLVENKPATENSQKTKKKKKKSKLQDEETLIQENECENGTNDSVPDENNELITNSDNCGNTKSKKKKKKTNDEVEEVSEKKSKKKRQKYEMEQSVEVTAQEEQPLVEDYVPKKKKKRKNKDAET